MVTILSAAVLYQGEIITGKNHGEIIRRLAYGHLRISVKKPITSEMQGFVTSDGKFINRIEAGVIALESNQIKKLDCPPQLFSEDLIK